MQSLCMIDMLYQVQRIWNCLCSFEKKLLCNVWLRRDQFRFCFVSIFESFWRVSREFLNDDADKEKIMVGIARFGSAIRRVAPKANTHFSRARLNLSIPHTLSPILVMKRQQNECD